MLKIPHADKAELEKLVMQSAAIKDVDQNPGGQRDSALPQLQEAIIVRPALLTDGTASKTYRADEVLNGAWRVSRADVGHFIYSECLGKRKDQGQWVNKAVLIAY